MEVCQNILVPALDAGTQKNRPYQSDIYTVSFHAIPRQAREQGSFDTPSFFLLTWLIQVFYVFLLPDIAEYENEERIYRYT